MYVSIFSSKKKIFITKKNKKKFLNTIFFLMNALYLCYDLHKKKMKECGNLIHSMYVTRSRNFYFQLIIISNFKNVERIMKKKFHTYRHELEHIDFWLYQQNSLHYNDKYLNVNPDDNLWWKIVEKRAHCHVVHVVGL